MKRGLSIIFVFCSLICSGQVIPLFTISAFGRVGYINGEGVVVIPPVFRNAGEFHEGLAFARKEGTFGFIDTTGNFVIRPQFDWALPFCNGRALVFRSGRSMFIDRSGQLAFPFPYRSATSFRNGYALVTSNGGKIGCIQANGKLILDTIFSGVDQFLNGMAIVVYADPPLDSIEKAQNLRFPRVAVMDTTGQIRIAANKYRDIEALGEGYFLVTYPGIKGDTDWYMNRVYAIIDSKEQVLFQFKAREHTFSEGFMINGRLKIVFCKNWEQEEFHAYDNAANRIAYLDVQGNFTYLDTIFHQATEMSGNRAFVSIDNDGMLMINAKGEMIASDTFVWDATTKFENGQAFVKLGDKYGLIDTTGRFHIKPIFDWVSGRFKGEVFIFGKYYQDYNFGYGIADKQGRVIINPLLQDVNAEGYVKGMLRGIKDHMVHYYDTTGRIVWAEQEDTMNTYQEVNVDFMIRGYFYANSRPEKNELDGHGRSVNNAKRVNSASGFPKKQLSLIVRNDLQDTIWKRYKAYPVYLANTTGRAIAFRAQDCRLEMHVQAKDSAGIWRSIEYLPSSWCGNSYHTLTLNSKQYWKLVTPVYSGDFKTKMRIVLKYADASSEDKNRYQNQFTLYSNEYEGSVNPAQF